MFARLLDEIAKWFPWTPTLKVVLLAEQYDTSDEAQREAFMRDFSSRVQLTYRRGFSTPLSLVGGREICSDTGWGCMLRVMQMMLAQSFVSFKLGRAWRFDDSQDLAEGSSYLDIVSCFLDTPKAPFSLHSLVSAGQRLLGKEPSAWFGPTSAAQAVGHIFQAEVNKEGSQAPAFVQKLACVVFEDGAVYKDSVNQLFDGGAEGIIILLCRRLGLDAFNAAEYRNGIESCFELQEFQGLASGNSASSAHFFVATHGDSLVYLDPHTTHPALESLEFARGEAAPTLRASQPLPLRWARLNPSVCMGFLVRSREEFIALCGKLCEKCREDVFEVLDKKPSYASYKETTEEEDGDMVLVD
eukprot:gnl/TRDRNA2_/TRDRNA2_94392_c0_seq3.p1 gnl/TRDRNA2_/TRDRNA2_94392_c0~~gnl/TRDRNA2_/TRDRNA2_94392_c0_seq3.p1  ORF type:complete len:357 (-),score=68.21 gnl/TRDRNA2_/TRDRNA2_94392_c0_seq3:74-1144(-)